MNSHELISRSYEKYHSKVLGFILGKTCSQDDARDLAQDVFVRLLEYSSEIYEESVERLIFTIARNLVNDFLRRSYVRRDVHQYMEATQPVSTVETESEIVARDLRELEQRKLASMPRQRCLVYMMRRFEEKTAQEIAEALNISRRTAENHLYMGISQMRDCFRACI